jgi:transcriptional regulator with XRE-family HTH domain
MDRFSKERGQWLIDKINQLNKDGVTKAEIADKLGVKPQYLTPMLNGKRNVSDRFLAKFCKNYNIDYDALFSINDLSYKSNAQFYEPENKPTGRKLIPFYDTTAAAGTLQVSNMDPVTEPAEYIDAGDWFIDADSAMRVHGDSMYPEYKSGNIVVMREVFDKRLIVYGEDYMIQTSEYKVIKRLMRSDEKGYWLACSINDEIWEMGPLKGRLIHEPFPVFIDDVTKICRIIGCVKRTESSRIVYNKNKKM